MRWRRLEHRGPCFAPSHEPLPDGVRFFYSGVSTCARGEGVSCPETSTLRRQRHHLCRWAQPTGLRLPCWQHLGATLDLRVGARQRLPEPSAVRLGTSACSLASPQTLVCAGLGPRGGMSSLPDPSPSLPAVPRTSLWGGRSVFRCLRGCLWAEAAVPEH